MTEQHSETEVRPCPVAVTSKTTAATMKNRVLTENAKDLSPEQLHTLEMDILKPLDFYTKSCSTN